MREAAPRVARTCEIVCEKGKMSHTKSGECQLRHSPLCLFSLDLPLHFLGQLTENQLVALRAQVAQQGFGHAAIQKDGNPVCFIHVKAGLDIGILGAKGLRVSVSTSVPTVVVPADWDAQQQGTGIVVGVGPDEAVSARAIDFAARVAVATQQPLELISAWGVPAWLERTAESMGGGLAPVGEQRQIELDCQLGRLAALDSSPDARRGRRNAPPAASRTS